LVVESARAQSSLAVLQGQVAGVAGAPVARALVLLRNLQTNAQAYRYTNEQGIYYFSAVSPGSYSVRVDALGHQPEQRSPVELPVAARLELNFTLMASATAPAPAPAPAPPPPRPGASPSNLLAVMYGADAAVPQALIVSLPIPITETLVGSLSSLIDETKILELPLDGRDVYTLLVLQPGVTSDNATARGLGFSVSGQRVASSNFLLDGVDNNDPSITGRATRVSAEAVKEYRMTTSNFTAEYGRASGFIANAITRSGTNSLHGTLFTFFNHDRLNANSFGNNLASLSRLPLRQTQTGASVGGPLWRDRLFFFANFERAHRSSESEPLRVFLPSPLFVTLLPNGSRAQDVLRRFPPPGGDPVPGNPFVVSSRFVQPTIQRDTLGLVRLDYSSLDGRDRFSGRYSFSQQTSDDFIFSWYPDLNAPLVLRGQNLALNYTRELAGGANELKFGYGRNSLRALRPHPEIPTMITQEVIRLPGSEAGFDTSLRDSTVHLLDNFSRLTGRHALVFGGEARLTRPASFFSPGRDGLYRFNSIFDFYSDAPFLFNITLSRETGRPPAESDFRHAYTQREFGFFLHDNLSLTSRLTLNLGLRYESFGAPSPRDGTRMLNFAFGSGSTVGERIAAGSLAAGTLFEPDRNNFAPRVGFALDLLGDGKSVLRGGYGLFFDRVINDVWRDTRTNGFTLQTLVNSPGQAPQFEYTFPAAEGVLPVQRIQTDEVVLVDRALRTPYSQSWFAGLQRELTPNLVLEVSHIGSLGRKLVTSDLINRSFSVPSAQQPLGRFNAAYNDISYRANQGLSNFLGLAVGLNRRWSAGVLFQVSYTYGRTRDMQSSPIVRPGLGASRSASAGVSAASFTGIRSAFTRQFDPRADYGRSDFDQTHNLVFNAVAQSPRFNGWLRFLGSWQAATLIGIRSGFPFSVLTGGTCPTPDTPVENCSALLIPRSGGSLDRNRADFVGDDLDEAFLADRRRVPGGVLLLDKSKFRPPVGENIGNLPRNAFRGPGFWNVDFGLSRSFPIPRLGEQGRLQFRAEFFNLFNHTNLNNPVPFLELSEFGEATFERQGFGSSQYSASPLNEQPRRVQFALKVFF
jgi:hypothetical protein